MDLSNHLISDWSSLQNQLVCELGAGCGLVGIVAAMLGAKEVLFTDYDPGALQLIEDNIKANCSPVGVYLVRAFRWGDEVTALSSSSSDLLLGADLLYCVEVVEPLFLSVVQLLSSRGVFILATSFSLGENIDAEVARCTVKFKLRCEEVTPLSDKRSRIQYFHFLV